MTDKRASDERKKTLSAVLIVWEATAGAAGVAGGSGLSVRRLRLGLLRTI